MSVKTALVVGGGFVGAACAWHLQRVGYRVTLLDAGDPLRAASWGNAGHLAIEQVDPLASAANLRSLPRRLFLFGGPVGLPLRDVGAWWPFGMRLLAAASPQRFAAGRQALSALLAQAIPAWRRLVAQTDSARYLREDGHFGAWDSAPSAQRGKRHWLAADVGEARVAPASRDELALLRHRFNGRPVDAVRFQHTGQILDLGPAREGIVAALCQAGGAVRTGQARTIPVQGGRASVSLDDGSTLDADLVLVAAGAGSAGLLHATEGHVPLIAERGYHLESAQVAQAGSGLLPPVAFEDRSVIVTSFASSLRIAGFTEFSQMASPPDARKWHALSRHAAALGLPMAAGASQWIGARPTLPDYLPALGRSRAAGNLLYAFGHQHLGLTLSAITGELVAAFAAGLQTSADVRPFDLRRFQ
jgi:D-amino-acid dehydrogenase